MTRFLKTGRRSGWLPRILLVTLLCALGGGNGLAQLPSPSPSPATSPASAAPVPVVAPPPPAAPAKPAEVKVGVYLLELRDVSLADRTFKADFWLWSQTPDATDILGDLQFLNAERVTVYSEVLLEVDGVKWTKRRLSGVFRHNYDLRQYPFDQQTLGIDLLYAGKDARRLVLVPDAPNSGFDGEAAPPGWKIDGFAVDAENVVYASNLGDPALAVSRSEHSGLDVRIGVTRTETAEFWKLMSSLYIGVILLGVSFFLDVDAPAARYAMLGGAMFAIVLSLRSVGVALGVDGTAIEAMHYFALGLMVMATLVTLKGNILARRGVSLDKLRVWNYACAGVFLAVFAAANWWVFRPQ